MAHTRFDLPTEVNWFRDIAVQEGNFEGALTRFRRIMESCRMETSTYLNVLEHETARVMADIFVARGRKLPYSRRGGLDLWSVAQSVYSQTANPEYFVASRAFEQRTRRLYESVENYITDLEYTVFYASMRAAKLAKTSKSSTTTSSPPPQYHNRPHPIPPFVRAHDY